jgi:Flp pilus assembly protein TadD
MAAWPVKLAAFYPFRVVPSWQAIASAVLLAGITALSLRAARRHPAVIVGWLWYLVTLLPVIGLVQIGDQALADRYTYIPLIGIGAALCWLVPEALESRPRLRSMCAPLAAAVLLALSVLTVKQIETWRDEVTLYQHALSVTTGNYLVHDNLGVALVSRGRLQEAVAHFREAVRIRPGYAVAYSNLGNALADIGMREEAIETHRHAVRLVPGDALHRINLGSALAAAGRIDEAATEMAAAVRLQPDSVLGHTRLARLLSMQGKNRDAEEHLTLALRLDPANVDALLELGNLLASAGRADEARSVFQQVAAAHPSNAVAHTNLGILLVDRGDLAQGIASLSRAVELAPSMGIARENLARALVTDAEKLLGAGQHRLAVDRLHQALSVHPDSPRALASLAFVLATSDDAAVRDPRSALDLAMRARGKAGSVDARVLDSLAASLAASGRYVEAVREIDLAIAAAGNAPELRAALEARRANYVEGRPFVLRPAGRFD